jgi:uncharacterized protein DUF5670
MRQHTNRWPNDKSPESLPPRRRARFGFRFGATGAKNPQCPRGRTFPARSFFRKISASTNCDTKQKKPELEDSYMLWTIFVILLVLWLLGAFIVPFGGSLIHILLVIAVIILIVNLVSGRRGV